MITHPATHHVSRDGVGLRTGVRWINKVMQFSKHSRNHHCLLESRKGEKSDQVQQNQLNKSDSSRQTSPYATPTLIHKTIIHRS
ncbi:hypothetical protein E2C01_059476 [Portunus trituberculatus]|uniref:Uncharacterized protein n=1 Tax=Portunus trituberculatus TaxID=210409 RepID=A0A5B7H2N5_PORTR|nr:hypothetical protein [Portunus trituberculatus]